MDEDFFKDYPPVNGSEQPSASTNDAPAPSDDGGMNAFVLGDSGTNGDNPDSADDDHALGTNGGPPPDDNAEPECAAVTEWRAAFAKGLEEKVANERKVKAERAEQAQAALEAMHARWESTRRNAEDANIKSEKQFLQTRDGVISRMSNPGESPNWDIIPELVDMTGKYKEGTISHVPNRDFGKLLVSEDGFSQPLDRGKSILKPVYHVLPTTRCIVRFSPRA